MISVFRKKVDAPRDFLRSLFDRAVEVADPMRNLARYLPQRPKGRVIVVGAGKASARMAEAVEAEWGPCEGLVITRDGYACPTKQIEIIEASHPVPDLRGARATARILEQLRGLGRDDFVLTLISGGASSLLVSPAGAITLDEKRLINEALLASGAPIDQMNTVRKHLSRVKGGQLAASAYPARTLTLIISDVPGDDPAYIGSGPTVGEESGGSEALAVLERWKIPRPNSVDMLLSNATGVVRPDDPRLSRAMSSVIAAPAQSLQAAADLAEQTDIEVRILGDSLEGEARDVANTQARMALEMKSKMGWRARPVLLLSGGELTVTRTGSGIGGPNAEFALALALALNGTPGIHAIACDTDGVDGAADVAGAFIGPNTLERAIASDLLPEASLQNNDSHSFFAHLNDQVITGPTLTNVNDFRAILIQR